jgi:acyl carrier protein
MTPSDDYDVLGNHETSPSSGLSVGSEEDFQMRKMNDFDDGAPSIVRQIVAEEMGMSVSEIPDDADLAQLGMDSLMGLTMLAALRERTAMDLPSSFLIQNACIREMEEALGMRRQPKIQPPIQAQAPPAHIRHMKRISLVTEHFNHSSTTTTIVDETIQYPPATSVLLQGNAKTARQRVFLFPDGSGSATSYVSIPNLGPQIAIFGLNCPFMKTPTDFVCGIQGVAALYINEMKRRQPHGPYIIGGWSAGGVIAYEVAVQLYAMGESVERLLLMDSPCPINLDPLPARLHHFFDSIGLLGTGTGRTPAWLLPHFESSIKALEAYKPQQLPRSGAPRTFALWATDGVCGKPGDPRPPPGEEEDPKPMKWLLNNRTDFEDNGWGSLLGMENMEFSTIRANHFTMMRENHVSST